MTQSTVTIMSACIKFLKVALCTLLSLFKNTRVTGKFLLYKAYSIEDVV